MNKRLFAPAAALASIAVAVACGNDKLRRNSEVIEVVEGEPGVGQGLPGVTRGGLDGGVQFGGAAPYQVDSFVQPQVSKVDILWVIDDSPSMGPKQDRVKSNFLSFMTFLSAQQIDYHLGVTTTDTYATSKSGKLQNSAGLTKPWIDLQDAPDGGQLAFVANASVGIGGSGDEKGLLGGMLALTTPLETKGSGANCTASECFLRSDAQLYTIVVSDEEDSSCTPIRSGGLGSSEGCDDGQATLSGIGSIAYWSRFYSGIKGPGGVSRLAAITGTDNTFQKCNEVFARYCDSYIAAASGQCVNAPDCSQFGNLGNPCCSALSACGKSVSDKAQWCEVHQANVNSPSGPYYRISGTTYRAPDGTVTDLQGFPGCVASHVDATNNQKVIDFTAYYAPRYTSVAQATGGIATSICDADYTPALEKLGLQASGLRSDFPLSRAPVDGTLQVAINGTNAPAANWQYVKCSGASPVNSIVFNKASLPAPGAKIAVSYDVNVRGLVCP